MNKVYVIADIHGCHRELDTLFTKIDPDEELDTVVFLGDYINRGPASREVVETILGLKRRFQHLITLMGNHEQILVEYLAGEQREFFLKMGGDETLKSYGLSAPYPVSLAGCLPVAHELFFKDLLSYWETDSHIFVHAGLQPGVHISRQSSDWLFWARDEFIHLKKPSEKTVIYGHTPFAEPKVAVHTIGIDTGVVYGGKLTCLVLPEGRVVQVGGSRETP